MIIRIVQVTMKRAGAVNCRGIYLSLQLPPALGNACINRDAAAIYIDAPFVPHNSHNSNSRSTGMTDMHRQRFTGSPYSIAFIARCSCNELPRYRAVQRRRHVEVLVRPSPPPSSPRFDYVVEPLLSELLINSLYHTAMHRRSYERPI